MLAPIDIEVESCPKCSTQLRVRSPLFKTCRIGKPIVRCRKCGQEATSTFTSEWQCLSPSNQLKYVCNATTVALLIGTLLVGGTLALVAEKSGTTLSLQTWLLLMAVSAAGVLSWHLWKIGKSITRTRDADYWHKLYTAGAMRRQAVSAAGAVCLALIVATVLGLWILNFWASAPV